MQRRRRVRRAGTHVDQFQSGSGCEELVTGQPVKLNAGIRWSVNGISHGTG
jgi:hypothetical protein